MLTKPIDTQPPLATSETSSGPRGGARDLQRIMKIRVPVIVQLASRSMRLAEVRNISIGVILQFDKDVESPLELLVNNQVIARGQTIKVGEQFGLRLQQVLSAAQRVRSLGG